MYLLVFAILLVTFNLESMVTGYFGITTEYGGVFARGKGGCNSGVKYA